jgi:trigger factor
MQTHLENLGPLKRRLDVSVPRTQIDTEIESRLKRIARTAKMHGFRPGKVPMKVIEQTYGPQVRQEVLGDAVQRTFAEAVRSQNLRVAGYPAFEARGEGEAANEFQYSATFEVYPEVGIGDVSAATIERPVHEVTDGDVASTIDVLRKQRVTYSPVDRAAAEGDRVVMDYRGTIEGEEFDGGKAEGFPVVLGQGRLLADFETALAGMKGGESKSFTLTFPVDYHGKDVAGKTATFEVSVKVVEGPKLPDLDAEFARSLGVADGDMVKMRAEVRANVEREVARRVQARVKEQVMNALIAAATLELPQALVDAEKQRLVEAARSDLASRGVSVDGAPIPADLFEQQAQRRVKLGLILAETVKAKGLHAKPEQVRAVVEDMAQSYEHPDEVVKWYYAKEDRLNDAEAVALEDNVVNWVLSQARVSDKPVTFEELTGSPKV